MSTVEYHRKLDELDRLLNDPDVPMQPDRIWSLLADVSKPAKGVFGHVAEVVVEAKSLISTPP